MVSVVSCTLMHDPSVLTFSEWSRIRLNHEIRNELILNDPKRNSFIGMTELFIALKFGASILPFRSVFETHDIQQWHDAIAPFSEYLSEADYYRNLCKVIAGACDVNRGLGDYA